MNLLTTILWLEMRRLRVHPIVLGMTLLFCAIALGVGFSFDFADANIHLDLEGDVEKVEQLLSIEGILKLFPFGEPIY